MVPRGRRPPMTEQRTLKRRAGIAEEEARIKKERLEEAQQEYEEEHITFTIFSKHLEEKWEQRFDALARLGRDAGVRIEDIAAVRQQPRRDATELEDRNVAAERVVAMAAVSAGRSDAGCAARGGGGEDRRREAGCSAEAGDDALLGLVHDVGSHDVFTPSSCVHAVCSRHGTAERQTAAARQATSERAMNTVIEKKFRLFVRAMNTVIEKKFRLEMSSWREFITAAGEEGGVRPHGVSRAPCTSLMDTRLGPSHG
jgi:hypothetical protein